jgi:hypothetical protein
MEFSELPAPPWNKTTGNVTVTEGSGGEREEEEEEE